MGCSIRPLVFVSAFVLSLPRGLAGQGSAPVNGHWNCESATGDSPIYVTATYDGNAVMAEVQNGFQALLFTKYGYKGEVSCHVAYMSGSTLAKIEGDNDRQQAQWQQSGKQVIKTGWKFDPETARLPYVCQAFVQVQNAGQRTPYVYQTGVLRMPGSRQMDLSAWWHDHLQQLHPGALFNPANCKLLPPDPAVQQVRMGYMVEQFKSENPQVVKLDWTYQPVSPAAVSASAAPAASPTPAATPAPASNPAPAATAAAPASQSVPYYCEFFPPPPNGQSGMIYRTDVFTSTVPSAGVTQAWHQYVMNTYHPKAGMAGTCDQVPTNPVQQQNVMKGLASRAQAGGVKIVIVKWSD